MQDYLTKYPEAVVVKNTAAKDNIRALEEVFGRHGYPEKMVTDNGPPWNGKETHTMKQYLEWAGVEHDPTHSADDPEANGLAERLMQLVGKSWETAYVEGRDPLLSLNTALRSYRNTEHSVTGRKPAEWMFGRPIRTRLPNHKLQTQHDDAEATEAKERMKERGEKDKKRRDARAREEELQVGMKVLLKRKKKRKGMPIYDPEPYTITKLFGRQAVIERGGEKLNRETQKFKRFYTDNDKADKPDCADDDWEDVRITTLLPEQQTATVTAGITEADDTESLTAVPDTEQATAQVENEGQTVRRSSRQRRAPDAYGSWDTGTGR
jgi:hypothetical protein